MTKPDTLCVWDGILEAGQANGSKSVPLTWYGTWLSHENAPDASKVPEIRRDPLKEFVDSDMKFNVSGTAATANGSPADNAFQEFRATMAEGEGYDMKGVRHTDQEHEILFGRLRWQGSPDKRNQLLYGRGKNEFGTFISVGWMRPGNRATLARRYVTDGRADWKLDQVRENLLKDIYDQNRDTMIMPPWQIPMMNA
uniref:Uncharacterized protein n=1 Tax=Grammatophora oceanica TaxID=210454 RepID=A0A7S1YC92_9STRA